jgi:hypothetical protein
LITELIMASEPASRRHKFTAPCTSKPVFIFVDTIVENPLAIGPVNPVLSATLSNVSFVSRVSCGGITPVSFGLLCN